MFKRKSHETPTAYVSINADAWDSSSADTWDDWGSTPEQHTGPALWGEQNVGATAASAVLDGPRGFLSRASWGPDGRVLKGVQAAQGAVDALHSFADSGVVHAAEHIPVAGKYLRTAEKIVHAAHTVSHSADEWGGVQGIVEGAAGAMRDPRAAMEFAREAGGKVLWEGVHAAFDSVSEQVTVERRDGRRRLGIGKVARVAANLLKTGGASGVDMLVDAGIAGMTAGKRSAMDRARQMPGQLASIPDQFEDGWGSSTSRADFDQYSFADSKSEW